VAASSQAGAAVSPAAKLCGFLILLGVVFAAAYLVGARLGPVTTGHSRPAHGRQMNMGAPAPAPVPARERQPGAAGTGTGIGIGIGTGTGTRIEGRR
jgi:hypothetical protein